MKYLLKKIDHLIPDELKKSTDTLHRSRVIMAVPALLIISLPMLFVRISENGFALSTIAFMLSFVLTAMMPIALIKTKSFIITGIFPTACVAIIAPMGMYSAGGLFSPPAAIGPIFIATFGFMFGIIPSTIAMILININLFIAFHLHKNGNIPLPVGEDFALASFLMRQIIVNTAVYIIMLLFEVSRKKTQQQLKENIKTKSRLLANMSHEIRTPMNGVLGMTTLLKDKLKTILNQKSATEIFNKIKVIEKSGESLLSLINDILDFSKLEAGKMELEITSFNVIEMVEDLCELLSTKTADGVVVKTVIKNQVPAWIQSDQTKLLQVLTNLIGNAIKFTQQGDVTISIDTKKQQKENNIITLQFSVKDSGIGISKEAKEKLFQEFSQVDASTTRKFGGTGLGLSICKGFVELMGGNIWVESNEGYGSSFSFTIVTKTAQAQESSNSKQNYRVNLLDDSNLRILVAEDNSINCQIVEGFLEKLNLTADFAYNGSEVLEKLENNTYDIILMDCHMPVMNGFETTKNIIKKLENHRPRIVALTASAMKEEKDACFAAGMDDFISKPIRMNSLIEVLSTTIRLRETSKIIIN